uniref:Alpha 1,4-glycosyltransferase domain-containing protein n=1 Tax=Leptobrachium leishanense TaxID=445787 RepID=A0A8C5M7K8_9ANUR
MIKYLKVFGLVVVFIVLGFLSRVNFRETTDSLRTTNNLTPNDVLREGNGVILLEISDRMNPPPLVLCSIESAARVYPERPVAYFMKGLPDIESGDYQQHTKKKFPTLSSFQNIYYFPLRMDELYADTPLLTWYKKVNPKKESYWIHVSSDACRFASMWKYGGIYFDTDIISMRPIPHKNFLAAQSEGVCSSSVFGLDRNHSFTWMCMEDFVKNYKGELWGNQGPSLFTRVLKTWCNGTPFQNTKDASCGNIPYLNSQRFYPIPWISWKKYYEVWKELPNFNSSYSLHLWNFMNSNNEETVVPRSNTLVEYLFQQFCPTTYAFLLKK